MDVAVALVEVKVVVTQAFAKLVVAVTVVLAEPEAVDEAVVAGLLFPQLAFPQVVQPILPFPQVVFPLRFHRFHLLLFPHLFHLVVAEAVAVAVAVAVGHRISHHRREISEPKPEAIAGAQVLLALKLATKLF